MRANRKLYLGLLVLMVLASQVQADPDVPADFCFTPGLGLNVDTHRATEYVCSNGGCTPVAQETFAYAPGYLNGITRRTSANDINTVRGDVGGGCNHLTSLRLIDVNYAGLKNFGYNWTYWRPYAHFYTLRGNF